LTIRPGLAGPDGAGVLVDRLVRPRVGEDDSPDDVAPVLSGSVVAAGSEALVPASPEEGFDFADEGFLAFCAGAGSAVRSLPPTSTTWPGTAPPAAVAAFDGAAPAGRACDGPSMVDVAMSAADITSPSNSGQSRIHESRAGGRP
jgi:hypothetical protein